MKESAAFLSKLTQLASPVPFSLALSHTYHALFIQLFSDGSSRSRRASSCGDLLSLSWTLLGPPLICKFVCGLADRILGVKWQIMIGSARVRQSVFKFRRERIAYLRRCNFFVWRGQPSLFIYHRRNRLFSHALEVHDRPNCLLIRQRCVKQHLSAQEILSNGSCVDGETVAL